jgi:hypothetical protein
MDMGYSTQVYYNMHMSISLVDVTMWPDGGGTYPDNYVVQYYNNYLPAYNQYTSNLSGVAEINYFSNHEYSTEMHPTVEPMMSSYDGPYFRDYYNFAYFNGFPVLWPAAGGSFGFYGPGPETNVTINSILLGVLSRLVINGTKSGTPDHFHCFFDETITRTDACGQLERHLDFSVVDSSGNRVGRVAISEAPPGSGLRDSCNNGVVQDHMTISCNDSIVNVGGNFRDTMRTGCPTTGGHCGSAFYNTWRWCVPSDGSVCKNLASMFYSVHHDEIKVDNSYDIRGENKY